jgi:hypothetical protein
MMSTSFAALSWVSLPSWISLTNSYIDLSEELIAMIIAEISVVLREWEKFIMLSRLLFIGMSGLVKKSPSFRRR